MLYPPAVDTSPTATAGPIATPTATTSPTSPPVADPTSSGTAAAARPVLAVGGDGLALFSSSGSSRLLPFGTAGTTLREAVTRALGAGASSPLPDCGPTVTGLQWPGLQLLLVGGRFEGWGARGPAARTHRTGDGLGSAARSPTSVPRSRPSR